MNTEQFNKLRDNSRKADYLIEHLRAGEGQTQNHKAFNIHGLNNFSVVVERSMPGDQHEMIAFDKVTEALNFVTFRYLKRFS